MGSVSSQVFYCYLASLRPLPMIDGSHNLRSFKSTQMFQILHPSRTCDSPSRPVRIFITFQVNFRVSKRPENTPYRAEGSSMVGVPNIEFGTGRCTVHRTVRAGWALVRVYEGPGQMASRQRWQDSAGGGTEMVQRCGRIWLVRYDG